MLKKFVGEWNTKTIVAVAIGAALYGVLMVWGSIPVFTNTNLTSAMIVPVVVGALFGPLPATVALLVGNCLADLIGGWGFWFDWSIGNGVLGLFVGLLPLYGADIKNGIFKVNTPRTAGVVLPEGKSASAGLLTVKNRKSFSACSDAALDARIFADSGRMLFLHITNVFNSRMKTS